MNTIQTTCILSSIVITLATGCGEHHTPDPPPAQDASGMLEELCPELNTMEREDCTLELGEVTTLDNGFRRPPNLRVSTPEEIAFICQSPCKQVFGNLSIHGDQWAGLERALNGVEHITQLNLVDYKEANEPLPDLQKVDRSLNLTNYPEQNISGFENLQSAGIGITGGKITNLNGLDSLTTLVSLKIEEAPIRNLEGLESITKVDDCIKLAHLDELSSLKGLESVETIGEEVWYGSCDGDSLRISQVKNITDLSGLDSLTTVHDTIGLSLLPKLETLAGLGNLATIGGLYMSQNDACRDIRLPSLRHIGDPHNNDPTKLDIAYNPNVPSCQIQELVEQTNLDPEAVYETNNGEGTCD